MWFTRNRFREEQKARQDIQAAVDRHVRNWLSAGVEVPVGVSISCGHLAVVEWSGDIGYSTRLLKIYGHITDKAYEGLWVSVPRSPSVQISANGIARVPCTDATKVVYITCNPKFKPPR